jgi:hypothetical protein
MVALTKPSPADKMEAILFAFQGGSGLRKLSEGEIITREFFAPGLYVRSLTRKAGTLIVGHKHKLEHMCILLHGRLRVFCDGKVTEIVGPSLPFVSKAGTRKVTFALEDSTLISFHPTNETDPEKLEEELIEKSPLFTQLEQQGIIKQLQYEP